MKKFTDIMFDDLSSEQLQQLPDQWGAAWIMRPKRDAIDRARYAMYFRASLIAGAALYSYSRPDSGGGATFLLVILAMYEFAYYILRKEKCEQDYALAKDRYIVRAQELDSEA